MESSIKEFLKSALGDYLTGLGQLDRQSLSEPLTLRNVRLKKNAINEDLAATDIPLAVHNGEIGALTFSLNWSTITFEAEDLDANFSMATLKLAKSASEAFRGAIVIDGLEGMDPRASEDYRPAILYDAKRGPGPNAPAFCARHGKSEQRTKCADPALRECAECKQTMSTNYETFAVCPPCSRGTLRCMICGEPATDAPANPIAAPMQMGGQVVHNSQGKLPEKTVESEPELLEAGEAAWAYHEDDWHSCTIMEARLGCAGRYDVLWEDGSASWGLDADWVLAMDVEESPPEEPPEDEAFEEPPLSEDQTLVEETPFEPTPAEEPPFVPPHSPPATKRAVIEAPPGQAFDQLRPSLRKKPPNALRRFCGFEVPQVGCL